ncbi:degV family protein [Lentilactobacillus otakiensis DSM 19908 = JCM 15040]|uniref:DegV family protein n=1 Tax=Lentilactobacillus otakiensis DSM 19908 = JCM 15040 TaxID=1423780 RepID=S4NC75_9LACO|nr:DegV family protein [Lentilactobacillus otakiensis]KRL10194.1 degV family protein [Lentilactobacillus otakiensis DSM 19908 = JCM 15040]GAD16389.1 degV family protein [Lentilactobacillus otakiensis DSM 19908 = JCM 15040]
MPEKIAILADSGSDVPAELLQKYDNIEVAPMLVTMTGKEYRDNVDITPEEFYARLGQEDQFPKTAAPTQGSVEASVDKLRKRGFDHIIGITVSARLSTTFGIFTNVARETTDIKMDVINTKNIGIGSGLFAVYAEEMIDCGQTFDETMTFLKQSVKNSRTFFYIPSLKYLRAGGRIGRVAGLIGSVLNIKPVIATDSDGIYFPVAKARSEQKAISKMVALVEKLISSHKSVRVGVANGADVPLQEKVYDRLHSTFPQLKIYRGSISPALGVHTGPGLVGVGVQVGEGE